ncbi:hypothetical protein COM89_23215 [Bacillus thuringiensis]|uniref:hypothetical protein n=1 Tax=Bacillus thuringiensis TaxID=1428 RepID=UPI000BEC6CD7|nr:hypothetical protein [Bacillus thuringiensis]PEB73294.1 hypothetical protein COM89_23215 [Bacillus thuringiensis]
MKKITLGLAVMFFVFIINVWMENATDNLYANWLKPVFDYKFEFVYVLLAVPVIYLFVDLIMQNKDGDINNLKEKNDQLEEQLKEETKGLWRHFKDLNRFNVKENLLSAMKTFVDNETHVIAAQLYEYTIKESSKQTSVKVSHLDGYVAEGEELNALLQEYYYLDPNLYSDFKKASVLLKKNDNSSMLEFINKTRSALEQRSAEDLNGDTEASLTYSLSFLAVQSFIWYSLKFNESKAFSVVVVDEEKDEILYNNKRSGILRTILNSEIVKGEYYIFYHNGHNDKKGRIYFTKTIKVSGKRHVLLITLNDLISEKENWVKHIEGIGKDFVELLKDKGLNVEYEQRN